jgi:ATP-dependent Clp endopeptidase proteolytic subunit ClpP
VAKKVKISGPIIGNNSKWIYDLFGMEAACPKDIEDVINSIDAKDPDKDLEVFINSGGGSVTAGSEIYTLLMLHGQKASVDGIITGMAASAASVIGMGCKNLTITPTGQVMIHNASTWAGGDRNVMDDTANMLRSVDESIANAYMLKTGMSKDELLDLMNKTTWMNAQQAVKMKFVDKILFDESNQLVASAGIAEFKDGIIPEPVINKLREMMASGNPPKAGDYTQVLNSVKKGVDPMTLEAILASLPEDQRKIVTNAIATTEAAAKADGKKEAEEVYATEKQEHLDKIKKLEANQKEEPEGVVTEEMLAAMDPKVRAIVEKSMDAEAKAKAAEIAAQAKLQANQDANDLKAMKDVCTSFDKLAINSEEMGPIFVKFSKTDNEGFQKLQAVLTAANNCVEAGKVFKTNGKETKGEGMSAWDQIQGLAKEKMTADSKVKFHDALTAVMRENPDLYDLYKDEMTGTEVTENE